jgi:hypothetical protein
VRCGLLSLLSAVLIVLLMGGQTPVVGASVVPVRAVPNDTAANIIAIPTGTPQSQQSSCSYGVCGNEFSPLEVRVLDSSGNAEGGVTVTFTAPPDGPSVSFNGNGTSEQQVTDAQGFATVSDAYENGTIGSYEVSATAPGTSTPAVFYLTNTDGVPDNLDPVLSTMAQSTTVGTAFTLPLQARLTDSSGNPGVGVAVVFTVYNSLESGNSGQASATFSGGVTIVTENTNADGVATAPSLTANSTPGAFVVTAGVTGAYGPAVFDMTGTETTTTVLTLTTPKLTYGHEQTEQLSVTVSPEFAGSTPYGSVTIKESTMTLCVIKLSSGKGSCTLSATKLGAGTYGLVATYGRTNFKGSTSAKETLTVTKATSKTVLKPSATMINYGHEQTERLSVTVSPQYSGTTPYGSVTIKESTMTLCVITLSAAKGSCTLSAKKLSVGTYYLVATYGGSTNFKGSTSAKESLTVVKASSKTALKLSNAKLAYGDEQVEHLSVTVSPEFTGSTPTGTVTIKESRTTLCVITLKSAKGSCTLSTKKLSVGIYSLVATYGGSTNFKGSTSAKETLTVVKATSRTVLKFSAAKVTYGDEGVEQLSVTVSPQYSGSTPTGTVTVKQSTTTLCTFTLSGARGSCTLSATKLPAGTYSLVATYGGSTNFKGSTSAKETLTVAK